MYTHMYEELAWAIAREREEEALRRQPRPEQRRVAKLPLRSRLARELVWVGAHLDRNAAESALGAGVRDRCHCGVA